MALWHYLLLISISLLGVECRIITLNNGCDTTIWPGFLEFNPGRQPVSNNNNNELASHNFELKPRESINITTPEDWRGLIWGRDRCSFDGFGIGTCVTGDCEGMLQCGGLDRVPFTSFTSAYISMDPSGNDAYSIGLDNGFNLPMSISPYGHNNPSDPCPASSCLSNINRICPSDRQVTFGDEIVACKSDCVLTNQFDIDYCCLDPDEPCKASNYSTAVKEACPTVVLYGDNDFRCAGGANYMVSFCG